MSAPGGSGQDSVPMDQGASTAFVLAGGGSKGVFEAGAVAYLVDELAVIPDVITATSAGAICGAVLAQARTHEEFVLRVRELEADLLAMTHTELVYGKQPWLAALDGTPIGRVIQERVIDRSRPPRPDGLPEAPDAPDRTDSRLARVRTLVRALPRLRHARRHLRTNAAGLLSLEPLAEALRGHGAPAFGAVDPSLIARPGLALRMAVVALGAGELRYVTEDGTIVAADAQTPVSGAGAGPVDVLEGMLASASVPMIFPPRPLADDVYVDGGVANNVPVDAAVRLGARRIFAVLAVPLRLPRDATDWSSASGPAVYLRAAGLIAFAERQRANLAPQLPPGTELTVIDPLVDVVGAFEVAHGLMLIDIDYGWLRAADLLVEVADEGRRIAHETTDAIVTSRVLAWHREEAIWASGHASAAELRALAQVKGVIRDAVGARHGLGLPVPAAGEQWWAAYESHAGPRPAGLPEDPSTVR